MELREAILSTIAEIEEDKIEEVKVEKERKEIEEFVQKREEIVVEEHKEEEPQFQVPVEEPKEEVEVEEEKHIGLEDERVFCNSLRERVLVLFEGFQSPNNKDIESKVDLTLNFLEYTLAVVDERLEKLDNLNR